MNHFIILTIFFLSLPYLCWLYNFHHDWDPFHSKYTHFSEKERLEMVQASKEMFQFGYDNYMKYAFPEDELDPIHCRGRGADHARPENININDVLGDYALTLVESLDTLAIMGNSSEFKEAVRRTIEHVSFDKNTTVQVFEATIRMLGSLLSAHLIIKDSRQPFGNMSIPSYDNELLDMAHDLANRLLPAFSNTPTGIPFPRISLNHGVPFNCVNETCTSGAGTLVLEFGVLSHLLDDPVYEGVARRAVSNLWNLRSNVTGLLGNVINIQTGEWVGRMSGLGAGIDSFFEYLLKAYILFGDENDLKMFNESYEAIKFHLRRGRESCNRGSGKTPMYVNVNMRTGDVVNTWIDALQAAWSAVQVLNGDIEEAICSHAVYYTIWRRYSALPERYNWQLKSPDVNFYPLRPELVESTYFLYRATKNPFYLHVGRDILRSIDEHTKETCGYCTIHDVHTKELEDRMESFFLSETCKYLYLLFDIDNPVNKDFSQYLFSTEGHIFPIDSAFRKRKWKDDFLKSRKEDKEKSADVLNKAKKAQQRHADKDDEDIVDVDAEEEIIAEPDEQDDEAETQLVVIKDVRRNNNSMCDLFHPERRYNLPLLSHYLTQIEVAVGLRSDGDL